MHIYAKIFILYLIFFLYPQYHFSTIYFSFNRKLNKLNNIRKKAVRHHSSIYTIKPKPQYSFGKPFSSCTLYHGLHLIFGLFCYICFSICQAFYKNNGSKQNIKTISNKHTNLFTRSLMLREFKECIV